MSDSNEDKEVVLDSKLLNPFVLHKLIKEGGSIKFQNYPFGIRVVGLGNNRTEIRLFAIPVGVKYVPHMNPYKKKEEVNLDSFDEGTVEM